MSFKRMKIPCRTKNCSGAYLKRVGKRKRLFDKGFNRPFWHLSCQNCGYDWSTARSLRKVLGEWYDGLYCRTLDFVIILSEYEI
jgi:predicted nucleic-acid-binding Zn-ribbon protein